MKLKYFLQQDSYLLGTILGFSIPVMATVIFVFLIRLVQNYLHMLASIRDMNILLLGFAVNLVVMRYYLINLKAEKTGKSLLAFTVVMIILFLIFLKNSNFTFPI